MKAARFVRVLLPLCLAGALLLSAGPAPRPASAAAGHWGTAEGVDINNHGLSPHPQVAVDDSGRATVVWSYYDSQGKNSYVLARRSAAGAAWEREAVLGSGSGTTAAFEPRVAVAPGGEALAVWQQQDSSGVRILANRCPAEGGWANTTQSIATSANNGEAGYPQAAINEGGGAVVVWSTMDHVWASTYSPAGGWGAPRSIEAPGGGTASQAQVAMDSSGNALAVWSQGEAGARHIYAGRYTAGTGTWDAAAMIDTAAGTAASPQLAMEPTSGRAVAVWEQPDGAVAGIWASGYTGTGWDGATVISAGAAAAPRVAVDAGGRAVAVWEQSDGTLTSIRANSYDGTAWAGAATVESGAGAAAAPHVAMDAGGDALAVWQQFDGTATSIWANRFLAGSGWGEPAAIETGAATAASARVAAGPDGSATAVWWQSEAGTETIWANRYTAESGPGPAVFSVLPARAAAGNSLEVVVRGINLTGATSVTFGQGVAVLNFVAENATHIRASVSVAPAAERGPKDVQVATPAGTAELRGGFEVLEVPAVAPHEPLIPGGSLVPTFSGSVTDPDGAIIAIQYRVDGGEWQTITFQRDSDNTSLGQYAFATFLPPGEHTVELRGADAGGEAVSETTAVSVTVGGRGTPAWVWVLAGTAVAAVAAAGGYLLWRHRRRRTAGSDSGAAGGPA